MTSTLPTVVNGNNHPMQVFKRNLLIHKISNNDPKYIHLYKQGMNSVFYNPDTFFSNKFNNNEVVVGKKTELLPIKNSINPNSSCSLSKQLSRKILCHSIASSNNKSIHRICSLKSYGGLNTSNLSKHKYSDNTDIYSNQRFIEDNELKKIYDDFRTLQQKNKKLKPSLSTQDILDDTETTNSNIKQSIERIFNSQEKTLNSYKKQTTQNKRIMKRISQQISKHITDLTMNQSNSYRMKKEIKSDLLDKINKHNKVFTNYDWELGLRRDSSMLDKKYINCGSDKYPKWQMLILHPIKDKEIIRNPKYEGKAVMSMRDQKEISAILDDNYLKKRITMKEVHEYKSSPSAALLDDLIVNGKDLITFEQENSKLIKGKKVLLVESNNIFNRNKKRSFVVGRNWGLPVVKRNRSFTGVYEEKKNKK